MKYINYHGKILDRVFKTEKERQEFHELYTSYSTRHGGRAKLLSKKDWEIFEDWKKNGLTISEVSQRYKLKYHIAESIINVCSRAIVRNEK